MSDTVLVPIDGSEASSKALDSAVALARAVNGKIALCHVVNVTKAAMLTYGNPQFVAECLNALRDDGRSLLDATCETLRATFPSVETYLFQGNPQEEIVRAASELRAGWIVMGSHGRSGLGRALLGSVAEGVLRHATVPLLIVPFRRKPHRSPQDSTPAQATAR
ncbi:MAG: universal stress protein [Candidatus Eremiobacteraeota bacterium]|nr:universal stress protein [Candidatus Eremiobacteraeota bacterium]